jgi:hypothetical protein
MGREAGRIVGDGHVIWRAAGASLAPTRPLGDYRVDLTGQGEVLEYRLTTQGGKLDLRGSGRWRPGSRPVFEGEARPPVEIREELAPLLRMLGKDTGAGAYTLTLDATTGLSAR